MEMPINSAEPKVMHIDLNAAFASIEQQANPYLRGWPLVVAAYASPGGCVLAPSIEAKKFGIKTGMRVKDAKLLCPQVRVLEPDPPKYRAIHKQFMKLFRQYSPNVQARSIDEAVFWMDGTPVLKKMSLVDVGYEIKQRMRSEIGDWLKCNVGIGTNYFLAKTAAGLHKPDGLDVITANNLRPTLMTLELEDLCGIARRNHARLAIAGITTPAEFLDASVQTLRAVFQSINGYYWYMRLRGYEVDSVEWGRRTIGHSYALPKKTADTDELARLLYKLCEKMGRRLRKNELMAQGMHVSCSYDDHTYWHHGHKTSHRLYATKDLFTDAVAILTKQPEPKPVRILAVNCFDLLPYQPEQLSLLPEMGQSLPLTQALDKINDTWGEFTVVPALMMNMDKTIIDRIAFGKTQL